MKARKTPIGTVTPGQAFQIGKLAADAVHTATLQKEAVTLVLEDPERRKSFKEGMLALINNLATPKNNNDQAATASSEPVKRTTIQLPVEGLRDFDVHILVKHLGFALSEPIMPEDETGQSTYRIAHLPEGWTIKEDEFWTYLRDERGRDRIEIDKHETKLLSRFEVIPTSNANVVATNVYDRSKPVADDEEHRIIFQCSCAFSSGLKHDSFWNRFIHYFKNLFTPSYATARKRTTEHAERWLKEHFAPNSGWHSNWDDIQLRVMVAN